MTDRAPTDPGYHADTHALVNRLRRIEGQVRGLQRVVSSGAYCIDVSPEEGSRKLEEATSAVARLVRS